MPDNEVCLFCAESILTFVCNRSPVSYHSFGMHLLHLPNCHFQLLLLLKELHLVVDSSWHSAATCALLVLRNRKFAI